MDKITRYLIACSLLCIALVISGCDKKPFSHIYDKSAIGQTISMIAVTYKNPDFSSHENIITKQFDIPINESALFRLETDYGIYPKRCNNPLATAEQKSYIGFVKLTLYKGEKRIYTTQEDFKTLDDVDYVLRHLLKTLIEDMQIKAH